MTDAERLADYARQERELVEAQARLASTQPREDEDEAHDLCPDDAYCPICGPYWDRMVREGLWDRRRGLWTDKGMRDMRRHA
jgi:hypothetical protein